jgi:hypothetical protein
MGGYHSRLPMTGAAGLTVAGIYFGQLALLGVAVALVGAGAVMLRLGWRRGKPVSDR